MKSLDLGNRQNEIPQVDSLGQSDGEDTQPASQPLPLATESWIELLRGLNDTFAAVLMNAQVLDGKLPSYSRSKRYIHEIERSAQRGGVQLKRLLDRLPCHGSQAGNDEFASERVPPVVPVAERIAVVASQGPTAVTSALDFAPSVSAHAAPDFRSAPADAHRRV